MARSDFPLSINRRRLLTAAAAIVTATGIFPDVKPADAAAADVLRSSPLTPNSPLKNVESSAFSVPLSSNSWGDRLVVSAVG